MITTIDRDGVCASAEGDASIAATFRARDWVGQSIFDLPAPVSEVAPLVERALGGESASQRLWLGDADVELVATPRLDGAAGVVGATLIWLERPERAPGAGERDALSQLRAAEERYRRIVETTSEGVWIIDRDAKTTFVNERMAAMLGYSRAELMGMSLYQLVDEELHAAVKGKLERRREGISENHELRYRRADGTPLRALVKTNPLFDAAGDYEGALALVTDVSERWQAEGARDQLAALIDSSEDAITGTDPNGIITSWNRAAERLYGYPAREVIGRAVEMLIPPERHGEERARRERVVAGAAEPPQETTRLRKDGSLLDVSLAVWPVRDAAGRVIGTGRLARDLTERRKSEARFERQQQQLQQAQKMDAIGNVASGVAHDFNNFLSLILTYGSLALENLEPRAPAYADVQQVIAAAKKAAELTRQLLTFSSQEVVAPQVIDLAQHVASMAGMLSRVLGENVRLKSSAPPDLWRIYADPGQVDQVIMNLALNARDAMPDGGLLLLETCNWRVDAEAAAARPELPPGEYVKVSVTDEGTGMPPAVLERIFEPFFSTKPKGKGTGLGLSTVFGIVKQVGGHLSVTSQIDRGTRFELYFPRTTRVANPRASRAPQGPPKSGNETLLVVEDDDTLRAALRTVLAKHGYRVLEAQNGSEALMISEHFQLPIHLLVTDLVMPRMDARELVPLLRAERGELRVLLISGYAEGVSGVSPELALPYLRKPVSPEALLRKVREVLDGPAPR